MGKWTSKDLGPRQVKEFNELLREVIAQHKTFTEVRNRINSATGQTEESRSTYFSPFGGGYREDLGKKLEDLYASYQGEVSRENLHKVLASLREILQWAKSTTPIDDKRESEEVLRERERVYQESLEKERARQAEFEAASIPIPHGMMGICLDVCFDNSDIMSDYFDRHRKIEERLLAIVPKGREDQQTIRNVLAKIPELNKIEWVWNVEKYSMGHGNYLESKSCPETREHPHKNGETVNCHYEITYLHSYSNHKETRAIPHPSYYQGEMTAGTNGNGGNGHASFDSITIRANEAMGGLEVIFPAKPDRAVIDNLKGMGFRWSQRQGLWWKRNCEGLEDRVRTSLNLG